MPETLGGLAIFVVSLTPGFVYLVRTETRLPERRHSPLRETVTIMAVSLVVNAAVLGIFAALRGLLPTITPDVGAFVHAPSAYFRGNYAEVTLWAGLMLLAAACLASVIAVPPEWSGKLASGVKRWPGPTVATFIDTRRSHGPIEQVSGWGFIFKRTDHRVFVGLDLRDGTYLYGPLQSFSPDLDENDERSITIGRPVKIRPAESDATLDWDVDRVLVSASEITTISVVYVAVEPDEEE